MDFRRETKGFTKNKLENAECNMNLKFILQFLAVLVWNVDTDIEGGM
jgi:hypothetical protein